MPQPQNAVIVEKALKQESVKSYGKEQVSITATFYNDNGSKC